MKGQPLPSQPTPLTPRRSPASFLALIADKLEATEAVFREALAADVPRIREAGTYLAEGGGKRVRPALVLLASRLLGRDGEEEVTYAAVVELIHTATLIHDDVIDHADLRRGQATLNQIWGNHPTVLLGDWIYTLAMQKALSHQRVEVLQKLVDATLRMTEGELLALHRLGAIDLTTDEYFEIIDRKTARLFAAACAVPALIPPLRPEAGEALERYGAHLGVCFQLVDDLLDFDGREEELGKPVLSDLKEGKLTLPLILLLPRIAPADRQLIAQVLEDRAFERVAAQQILELVEREGTLDETRQIARDYSARAKAELEFFRPCEAREALELAPDFVLDRRS
ncbi:MAG: polyprenyl synthetase family protein [Acidobacteriota bacterium]